MGASHGDGLARPPLRALALSIASEEATDKPLTPFRALVGLIDGLRAHITAPKSSSVNPTHLRSPKRLSVSSSVLLGPERPVRILRQLAIEFRRILSSNCRSSVFESSEDIGLRP